MGQTINDKYRLWMRQGQELVYEVRAAVASFASGLVPYTFVGQHSVFEDIHETDGKLWATPSDRASAGQPVETLDIISAYALLQQLQEEHDLMLKAKQRQPFKPT